VFRGKSDTTLESMHITIRTAMRNKDSSSTPARNSHWLIRLVRWVKYRLNVWSSPEGCTSVDARKLKKFNAELANEVEWWKMEAAQEKKCKMAAHDRLTDAYEEILRLQKSNSN